MIGAPSRFTTDPILTQGTFFQKAIPTSITRPSIPSQYPRSWICAKASSTRAFRSFFLLAVFNSNTMPGSPLTKGQRSTSTLPCPSGASTFTLYLLDRAWTRVMITASYVASRRFR